MSRKIIAVLTIATILFVCVFAACDKNNSESDDTLYVTDENGERVLADDGRFLVYETNAEGEVVTDESGEAVTELQIFEPIMSDGVIEDYGFKMTIPEGWKVSDEGNNIFVKQNKTFGILVVPKTYEEGYEILENFHNNSKGSVWSGVFEEDVDLIIDVDKACRFTFQHSEEEMCIVTFFSKNGNLYSINLYAPEEDLDIADMDAFLEGIEFKPFTYYPELTAESTEETVEETEATTK